MTLLDTPKTYEPHQIVTYTGKYVSPLDPKPEEIDIEDIAHALSNQCRFTGHTKDFYSVAQHCVLVSKFCDPSDAKWGLLHDASEAYLSDIARPLKYQKGLGDIYKRAEGALTESIGRHFGLPADMPQSVKDADGMLLRTEARDLMPETFPTDDDYHDHRGNYLDFDIVPWPPRLAYRLFMDRYKELFNGKH